MNFQLHLNIVHTDHHYSVKERGQVDRALGRAAFVVDLALKGPAEAFTPLKAVLGSISTLYTNFQVIFALFSKPLSNGYVSRTLSPSRTRSRYFARASPCWRSFSSKPQAMRGRQSFAKLYQGMRVVSAQVWRFTRF